MRRVARIGLGSAGVIALAVIPFAECGAQDLDGFYLGRWGGELGLSYAADRAQTSATGAAPSESSVRSHEEKLTVRNQGFFYLDPRLVTGNLSLTFGLRHDRWQGPGSGASSRGEITGYSFDSTILGEKPYSATLYANRSQSFAWQPFGTRVESSFEGRGATFRLREDSILRDWGLPYFSSTLGVYSERYAQSTTGAGMGQVFRSDERRDGVRFGSHKGFETADLDLNFEAVDHTMSDSVQGAYRTTSAEVWHSVDFGSTLNRRLDSRVRYSDRSGLAPLTVSGLDEHLHIDHYENLSTDYRYLLTRFDAPAGSTTAQDAFFSLRHRLYRNLTTSATLSASHRELPAGTQRGAGGALDFAYQHSLPRQGRLFASAGGGYRLNDNRLAASHIDVIDASYAAPALLGAGAGFLLANGFIDTSTIVVVDTRGGARLATTLGVDYDLVPEGNLTKVVPLPTSLVIQPGDPLAVSYSYSVDPSIRYATVQRRLGGGIDLRWVAVSGRHQSTDQTLKSGFAGQYLQDMRSDEGDVVLRGGGKATRGEGGASWERYDATYLAYTRRRLHELIAYRPRTTLSVTCNAEQTHTDYTLPLRQSETRSIQLSVTGLAPGAWWTTALVGRRALSGSDIPAETVNEARLEARKVYGQTDIIARLGYNDRERETSQAKFWHFDLNLTRRF